MVAPVLTRLGGNWLLARSLLHARGHGSGLRRPCQRHRLSSFCSSPLGSGQDVHCPRTRTTAWGIYNTGGSFRRRLLFVTSAGVISVYRPTMRCAAPDVVSIGVTPPLSNEKDHGFERYPFTPPDRLRPLSAPF